MARKSKYTTDQRAALRKARQEKQEKYWEDRAQSRVLATDRQVDEIRKDSDRAYRDARDAVRREIDKFYRDFATAAGISEDEARQKLSRGELQDFKKELERKRKIIREMIKKDPNNDKLRAYDTEFEKLSKVRELTRKEALETNIKAEIVRLGGTQEQQMNARSDNVVKTALWMNSADLAMLGDTKENLGVGHPEQVERAARENWQYGDFSDKIWDDKEKLIKEAREVIENGFAHNKGAYDMAGDLMVRMNVSHSNALRLVRTEFNHLSNQAALAEYQAKGIKKYKFVSAIDSRTCDVCAGLNGKTFDVADARTGKNFPPMHPNCRSVTTPVIDWGDEDAWDYSGIELDDDELQKLGLTDEDVAEIDAQTPKDAEIPAPSLSVQQANQATEDTHSVQRRAELAERIQKQTQELEVDVRREIESLDDINDDIKRLENINQRLDTQDVPMTLPRAAIEAENLESVDIDLKEKELKVLRLQERAAKLDPSVPKPDRGEQDRLADEIDVAKTRREERQKQDLPDADIIAQATPKPEPLPAKTAKDAEEPRTAIGKLWKRLKDGVDGARERFEGWIEKRRREMAFMEALPAMSNVFMVLGPVNNSPYLTPRAKELLKSWQHPGNRMPGQSLESLKQWESEYVHQNKDILKRAKKACVARLYTTPKHQRMNAYERMKGDAEALKREFSKAESDEIAKLNAQLSSQIKDSRMPSKITVARGLKTNTIIGKIKDGIYTEPGFTSTSLSEAQARNFAGSDVGAVMVYIDIPTNAPALYLEKMTEARKQYEILLDRGSRFRYLREGKMPDGTKFYHLELIVDD